MRTIKIYKMKNLVNHFASWQKAFQAIKYGYHYNYDGEILANFWECDKYFYYTPLNGILASIDKDLLDNLRDYYQDRDYQIKIEK